MKLSRENDALIWLPNVGCLKIKELFDNLDGKPIQYVRRDDNGMNWKRVVFVLFYNIIFCETVLFYILYHNNIICKILSRVGEKKNYKID